MASTSSDASLLYRAAGPGSVAALGLVLALAATTPSAPAGSGDIARRFIIDLPGWLAMAVVAAITIATLLFLALLAPSRRRRRKGEEEPPDRHYEPPKATPAVIVLLLLVALLPVSLIAAMIWLPPITAPGDRGIAGQLPAMAGPHAAPPAETALLPSLPPVHSAMASGILGTLAILAAAAALGFMLWVYFGDWLRRPSVTAPRGMSRDLGTAVAGSLDDLELEPDARRAIIKCYARFERMLAAADRPRAAFETPFEFMRAIQQELRLPRDPVFEMTRLFEISRFSRHELREVDRDSARRSLVSIKAALDRGEAHARAL